MRVDIKQGGDGFACWNSEAIHEFAAAADAREAGLAAANPDLVVTSGRVKCYGCQVLEFDMGLRCTAELTRTLYAVADEVAPRAADATGSLADIDGLRSRIELADGVATAPETRPATVSLSTGHVPLEQNRRSGLGRLLGRR
jgi:hypothetical protein